MKKRVKLQARKEIKQLKARQGLEPKKEKVRKASFGLEKVIKQLRAESSWLDKA